MVKGSDLPTTLGVAPATYQPAVWVLQHWMSRTGE